MKSALADLTHDLLAAGALHDMRHLLHPVMFSLDHLERREALTESAAEVVADARLGCDRLAQLLEQLLELARARHGAPPRPRRRVDARKIAVRAADWGERLGQSLGREIEVDIPELPVWIAADEALLERGLLNLLDNALRHGKAEAPVRVSCVGTRERVRLAVQDRGPGLSPTERAAALQPFRGGSEGGFGLGMMVSQLAAHEHGGELSLTSGPQGTTASLDIPRLGVSVLAFDPS